MSNSRIDDFLLKYKQTSPRPISVVVKKWVHEKKVDDFLSVSLTGGVLLGDLLVGGSLNDSRIPSEVRDAFENLMKEKADSYAEVRALLLEKIEKGDDSLLGLINKIQGQLGEDQFVKAVGETASLATSGSQEGWDVAINRGDTYKYVQVKVYDDPEGVIEMILEVNKKVEVGTIAGNSETVSRIDFAVNDEIFEEVKSRVQELGLSNEIINIGASREELRSALTHASEVADVSPFEGMFEELLGSTLTAAAIHAAAQGFLYWKGAKTAEYALEDTVYGAAISGGSIGAAIAFETFIIAEIETAVAILTGPLGAVCVAGVGMSGRAVLKRLADRRFTVRRLVADNERLTVLVQAFSGYREVDFAG